MKLFLNILFSLVALALAFYLFTIIREPIIAKQQNKIKKDQIVRRLEYVRNAQFAYKDVKGFYADSWDSLVYTCKRDSIRIIKIIGDPNDTTKITSYDTLFEKISRKFPENFYFDSLKYIPFGGGAIFNLEAGIINQRGVDVHVFQVTDTKPFDPERPLILGSMSDVNTSGNWK